MLSAADIKALWDGAARLPSARAAYLKLAILLPLRRQELADLKVSDIVFEGQNVELRLDGSKTKNSKTFVMPIVGTAAAIVREIGRPSSIPRRLAHPPHPIRPAVLGVEAVS